MKNFIEDYNERINPQLMTKLLSEGVPSIKDIEFRYLEVKRGFCKSILPLNRKSSNQHGTHQALLLGMGGDYTGGLALASIIHDEPILGVHEVTPEKGMSLWLINSNMKYLKPSVDDVIIEAIISEEQHEQLNKRYHNGSTILLDVDISFKNPFLEDVAIGKFRYYCKKKNKLSPSSDISKPNSMFEHILKTSAKLVSQLRAIESSKSSPLFIDTIAERVAGKQGKVIADRFLKILPELQNLVAARTFHLDDTIQKLSEQVNQIVFIGVGLDFRIYRQKINFKIKLIYELDLPEMLTERLNQISTLKLNFDSKATTKQIECNFLSENISQKLLLNGFTPQNPTLFIYEGCSMYFNEEGNIKILSEISDLMKQNENSVLWMDIIDKKAISIGNRSKSLNDFMSGMAKLGEPFICGFDKNDPVFKTSKLVINSQSITSDFIKHNSNDIYSLYTFNLLKYDFKTNKNSK